MFEQNSTLNMHDKSVNGQNCRKSALLSRLMLRHKLKAPLATILAQYIEMFKEVASLVFDIGLFIIG
jgi:hypothetical protein